jgi:acyl-CoA reductase-like NAD-dependent aldehyde dehydrogenase
MAKPFSKVRSAAIDGRAHNPFYKKVQLKKLHDKLVDSATEIQKAIADDTGHRPAEVKAEYWLAMRCVTETYKSIDPEQHLKDEYAIARSKDARDAREPVGIVVIEPTLHTFTFSLLCALGPALAAGNCIIVQVEQTMLKTPRLVLEIIECALDNDIVYVTSKPVTSADIGHRHVRVLQNGSSSEEPPLDNHLVSRSEGRVVAVVERDADLQAAADALVRARFGLRGKSPYAPDVVLVNEWVKKDFLSAVVQCSIQFMTEAGNDAAAPRGKSGKMFLDEVTKEGLSRIVSSGEYGMVVDIEDR